MDIHNPQALAPEILLGIVNEKLRLQCKDKAELLYELDMDGAELDRRLARCGYRYDPISNQYRAK
ncbi:DUF4250 domain-containing protein [Shewanella sedimentimangrovi]|uniref:DUF4250 domain-containing protein n=1 Tax=Shewanella sedimentimangrovi TaxID=2814293 RepID=A0ABX7QZ94_9GAMM|nr:DUF4250 domain-containing protein [Shewanella sedimentimangrovi]QSX35931.1 DUF4250 domain-containing protein [Shewanella sedimentimangrovi]